MWLINSNSVWATDFWNFECAVVRDAEFRYEDSVSVPKNEIIVGCDVVQIGIRTDFPEVRAVWTTVLLEPTTDTWMAVCNRHDWKLHQLLPDDSTFLKFLLVSKYSALSKQANREDTKFWQRFGWRFKSSGFLLDFLTLNVDARRFCDRLVNIYHSVKKCCVMLKYNSLFSLNQFSLFIVHDS